MSKVIGRVVALNRYPVKSMSGEALRSVHAGADGFTGDRAFGVIDNGTGRLLSAKTVPRLLDATAAFRVDGHVDIVIPGSAAMSSGDDDANARLSAWLGLDVSLQRPVNDVKADIDIELDLSDSGGSPSHLYTFQSRPGMFFDGTAMNVLSTAALAAMAAREPGSNWTLNRFRPNIVVEVTDASAPFPEDDWVGSSMTIGSMDIDVHKRCARCVLTTRAFPDAPADRAILRALHREHGGDLGVNAVITGPGAVSVGDAVQLT